MENVKGELKCFISAGIFVLLTLIRLLVPGAAEELHDALQVYISHDFDYTAVFARAESLGERLFLTPEPSEAPVSSESAEPVSHRLLRRALTGSFFAYDETLPLPSTGETGSTGQEAQEPDEAASGEADAEETVPECVQVFLDSQSAYSDYAVPANVSYDYSALPFDFSAPVAGLESSGFGYRLHPIQDEVKFHYGTDIAANTGDSILAFADGAVSFAGESESYGKYITVEHADGYRTLYAHCSELCVSAGESVQQGQLLALVGATGQVTGPHLHFELTHNGVYLNPEYYVNYA